MEGMTMMVFPSITPQKGKIITRAGYGSDNRIYVWGDFGNLQF